MRASPTKTLPVNAHSCATCPFREDGWTHLRDFLQQRALTEGTPICHSTGKALVSRAKRLGKARLCAGARQFQIDIFFRIGFLEAPTQEAWEHKWDEMRRAH